MYVQKSHVPNDVFGVVALIAESLSFVPRDAALTTASAAPVSRPTPRPGAVVRRWLDRLDHWHWQHRQNELEAVLAQSTDIADLERRMRAIERGVPARYY